MELSQELRKAASSLAEALQPIATVSSVGIGEEGGHPILLVYTSRQLKAGELRALPSHWENFPVRARNMGKVVPAGK